MYIFEIDLRIDFLPNLRQTQNTVEQMKKNRFVFNETRRLAFHVVLLPVLQQKKTLRFTASFAVRHQSNVKNTAKVFEKSRRWEKKSFSGILVIIMVVTFLIEFRLPNFSQTALELETGEMFVKDE